MISKYYSRIAAASLLPLASLVYAEPVTEPKTAVRGLSSFGTILVKGESPEVGADNIARFTVRMTGSIMAAYPTSSAMAVVFDDAMLEKSEVACPVINIAGRQRRIEEIHPDILQVEASVTPEEKERVLRSRCVVVTPTPAISEFKFLPRSQNNNSGYSP
ncbi:MAG: hypothetical protein JWO78_1864 [Micavibrio sp.]|nr:hypothetical protein [Micavibrio sp.]